jgi:hypothetical protein
MWKVLDRSEKGGEFGLTVQAAREIRGCLELCARLAGQIQESTVINIVNQPEWAVVQNIVMRARTAPRRPHRRGEGSRRRQHAEPGSGGRLCITKPRPQTQPYRPQG